MAVPAREMLVLTVDIVPPVEGCVIVIAGVSKEEFRTRVNVREIPESVAVSSAF